jgi:hypothetical protein
MIYGKEQEGQEVEFQRLDQQSQKSNNPGLMWVEV